MATLAPMSPHTRQPFGVISGSRLRNLGNIKNKQNALSHSKPSNLKTFSSQPQIFNDIDSENIDPVVLSPPTKSSTYPKDSDNMNFFKPAQFVLTRANAAPRQTQAFRRIIDTPKAPLVPATKRKADSDLPRDVTAEPDCERPLKSPRRTTPPPAGRSPKSKRIGILSRHRTSSSPFTRVDPPSFGSKKGHAIPFSIDAALAGTIPSVKSRKPVRSKEYTAETVLDSMPKGWQFDIYTDTKEEEASNLMEHSAKTLDISDDESSVSKYEDDENKENIPPLPGMNAPASSAIAAMEASRKHMMTDEPRSPLGELEPSDYYAAGCDATSYIAIPADDDIKSNIKNEVIAEASAVAAAATAKLDVIDENTTWNDLVDVVQPTSSTSGLTPAMHVMSTASDTASTSVLEQGPLLGAPGEATATTNSSGLTPAMKFMSTTTIASIPEEGSSLVTRVDDAIYTDAGINANLGGEVVAVGNTS